jgi:hypothetical protein
MSRIICEVSEKAKKDRAPCPILWIQTRTYEEKIIHALVGRAPRPVKRYPFLLFMLRRKARRKLKTKADLI